MGKVGKILIVVLSVIVVVGGVAGGIFYAKVYANPYNRLEAAIVKSMFTKQMDITSRAKASIIPEKYEEATGMPLDDETEAMIEYANVLLEKASFEANYKIDINDKNYLDSKFQYSVNMMYDNEKLLDMLVGMNEEELEVLMPSLISKTFFVTKDDLFKEMDFDYKDFDFEKYFAIIKDNNKLLTKVDTQVYKDIFKEVYEDKITKGDSISVELANGKKVKCREYIVDMSYDDIVDIMKDSKKALEDDDAFREYLRATGLALLEELLDSKDYKAFGMDKEAVEEAISYFEDEDDFEDTYKEMMVALDDTIIEMENAPEEVKLDYKMTYALDSKNNIRSMGTTMDYMGFVKIDYSVIYNSMNKKVTFDTYKDNERIDIMSLIDKDEEELVELFEEVAIDAGDKIVANKALDSLLKDAKDNSDILPEMYKEQLEMSIDDFVNNKEEYIKKAIDEAIESIMNPYGNYDYTY